PAPKLRSLVPTLDRDLETICAKCLERDPTARYRSAGALAEDLERWLEGRSIIARPVSLPLRLWRWSKRNRMTAAMTALSLALATVVGTLIWKGQFASAPPTTGIAVLPFESQINSHTHRYSGLSGGIRPGFDRPVCHPKRDRPKSRR